MLLVVWVILIRFRVGQLQKSLPEGLARYGDLRMRLSGSGLRDTELELVETFIRRCLSIDPASRPLASDLVKDGWLALVKPIEGIPNRR